MRLPLFGGDCYAYGLLAMGFADLVVEASLQPYDFMALVPVIEGAGGRITDWQGGALTLRLGRAVVAAGDRARACRRRCELLGGPPTLPACTRTAARGTRLRRAIGSGPEVGASGAWE